MNIRNSIKSILRTPVKSGMFLLLIAAVTAFLYLALNTWSMSAAMLRDSDEVFTTIVTLKQRDASGSDGGVMVPSRAADSENINFEAIASNEHVELWQPSDVSFGSAQGFLSTSRDPDYAYDGVFLVTDLRQYGPGSPYVGKIVETLYSFREYDDGRTVFFQGSFEDLGFEPEQDATYIVHTLNRNLGGNGISLEIVPFYNWWAEAAGVDTSAIEPFFELGTEADLQSPEAAVYRDIAGYYGAMNRALSVHRVRDLSQIQEFHQNYLVPESGRLFTREEAEAGERVAVVSSAVASSLELEVGDELSVLMPEAEAAGFYEWGLELTREETYTLVGIVNYHEEYHKNIYIPAAGNSPAPTLGSVDLGQATIKNGSSEAFLADIEPYLSENVAVSVYDQGYQAMADSLTVVRNAAIALSAIALLVALAVLVFFASQYADSQQETVGIMRSFGATKRESRRYLLAGSSVITLGAVAIGILVGMNYAEDLVRYALDFVADLQVVDTRYSDSFRGLVKYFNPVVSLSYAFAVIVGIAVLALSLGLSLFSAEKTVSGRLISQRAKIRTPRPVKDSSAALRGPLRHAVLAIRRDKGRSLLVVLLSAAALLFVASVQAAGSSYETARTDLYEGTVLRGYTSKMDGGFTDRLAIPNEHAIALRDVEGLSEVAYTYQTGYHYLGIARHADGSIGDAEAAPEITSGFQWENLRTALQYAPGIIFTDSVRQAPEFFFADFHAEFMEGWSEERFSRRDWEILPVILPSAMRTAHGIEYGDILRIYTQDHLYGANGQGIRTMEMQAVGSFTGLAGQNHIYASLPMGALDPGQSSLRELPFIGQELLTGEYLYQTFALPESELTQQQALDIILDNYYISSMTFSLPDPAKLPAVRDQLEASGFSGPGVQNDLRISVVVEDSQFIEALSTIDQRSRYLELLYPVLLLLVCLLGLLTGFLSVKARRENIALMRSLGAKKRTIFRTIFGEQTLLLLLGSGAAAILWLLLRGPAELASAETFVFAVSYCLSVLVSTLAQNRKSALAILNERE